MKCHTMNGLNNRKLLSSPSESQKSEIKVSPGCPPEGCGKGLLQASPGEQRRGKYGTGPAQAGSRVQSFVPVPGVSLPRCRPQLCYCLAGPSRESYLTSLNGDLIFCKMGIISAPHKIVERIKGAGAQFSSVGTNGLC